ncbi:50S ribosomal protein L11 methyltransferase [Methyloglobulus sp.]|uniref:50S ribosomal protein L11 methyltransferase n=1 Tax=Methyloglobulus sp. TaxID=2518622 RepID=UPI003988CC20
MAWHQISVITSENTAPKVADFFSDLGAVSVTYMDAKDEPVYEPAIGEIKIWAQTRVIALYELTVDPANMKSRTLKHFQQEALEDWVFEEIADQAWERTWMEYYRPMKFAGKLWVCPTGQEQREENTVCLILDPGLAFGTGTHPTTALCLEWLASHDVTGKTVIDYGCGSGILAIAALLLGARMAYAVDIDPQAITAAEDNAVKNNVQDKIICCLPEQFKATNVKADVVLANILAKPLIDMVGQIAGLVISKGQLVLSGILAEQADSVIDAYQPFLLLNKPVQQDDWVRLAGIKR